jgi:hypothetical protein
VPGRLCSPSKWRPSGWSSSTRWGRTPRFLLYTPGLLKESERYVRCRAIAEHKHHRPFEHDPRGDGSPALTVKGATTSAVFETYMEQVLAPTLRKAQVVVMDNLGAPTKESELRSSSKGGAASSSTCRPTRRTSTRSKKPSRRSRTSLEKARPGPGRRSWRPSAQRSRRSHR